jgi:hypothetical protein
MEKTVDVSSISEFLIDKNGDFTNIAFVLIGVGVIATIVVLIIDNILYRLNIVKN